MRGKSKLEKKIKEGVTKVKLARDYKGFYIPYCAFEKHPGIIELDTSDICEERKCFHYRRLYIK